MPADLRAAADAIATYTYGMDTADWDRAVGVYADPADIDYSAVGGPAGAMSRAELRAFLVGLLGKPGLRVHTALGQVLAPDPGGDEVVAYYSVRHYRGEGAEVRKFALFGWYRFRLAAGRIAALAIHVSATEGDPAVLA